MGDKRFRVAFSFAGEKREFVSQVADILAKRFGQSAILYDRYHEAEFARARLGRYLPKLYHDQSDLVVVTACHEYAGREWCGLEWDAIFDLLKQRREDEVMLSRFDHATFEGLFSDPGFVELDEKSPEQAATLILERLAVNEGKPKDSYTGSTSGSRPATTSIPNNLPRLQSFFGRDKELAEIREALDPESRTWGALIDGPGGMGKTSLAVRAAYDCPSGSFDRIIFLSVKTRELDDDGVRELGTFILPGFLEMLNELARQLEQQEILKAPEDQRIRLLLEALRPTRVLLILDNLESLTKADRDQLFTFIKRLPHGCKAILTSRRRIGSGSELVPLDKLDEAAALETLADLARHNKLLQKTNEAERLTLYRQTGGNPLLLRWVAGQLGRGSCRTFTDALHFLRSCPPENDPLEFVFGDLADGFTGDETPVLAALSFFTLAAKVQHISEVAGVDRDRTGNALRGLANRSLVVPDKEETIFTLVPMVAEFLRRKCPNVITETGGRLENRAYALIVENGYQKYDRFPILDAAWPTVAPALPLFLNGPNPRLQEVCNALQFFLEFTGRWDERLSLDDRAETCAVSGDDRYHAGIRSFQAGWVFYLRQQADAVLACADRAAAHWDASSAGVKERSAAIRLRGIGHQLKSDYAAAITAYSEALDLRRALPTESREVAQVLGDLAEAKARKGDWEAAERDYTEALRIARAIHDDEAVAVFTGNLSNVALHRENWVEAEALAREALVVAEKIHRQEVIAATEGRLGSALLCQGRFVEALPHARRAVQIYTHLGSPDLDLAIDLLKACKPETPES